MKRFLAILMAVLALVAVSVPSLAAGARGLALHPAPVVLLQASGGYAKAPCPLGGSGRVLACPTDIGVLPLAGQASRAAREQVHALVQDAVMGSIASRPHLPPPKAA